MQIVFIADSQWSFNWHHVCAIGTLKLIPSSLLLCHPSHLCVWHHHIIGQNFIYCAFFVVGQLHTSHSLYALLPMQIASLSTAR